MLDQITGAIVDSLHPNRIVLFGSRARAGALPDSDYDLFIEMPSTLRPLERAFAVHRLFPGRHWALDAVVFTPDEVRRWREDIGTLVYTVEREGRTLYERS